MRPAELIDHIPHVIALVDHVGALVQARAAGIDHHRTRHSARLPPTPSPSLPRNRAEALVRIDRILPLDPSLRALYPFCRLTRPANVLVMPGLHAAHILTRALPRLGQVTVIGPILQGLSRPVQIVPLDASTNQVVLMAAFAAYQGLAR